jgi:hypothetical protein
LTRRGRCCTLQNIKEAAMGWKLDDYSDEDMELMEEEVEGVWSVMTWMDDMLVPLDMATDLF